MELTFGSVGARHAAYPRGHDTPPGPRLLADRSAPSARPTLTPAQARRRVPPVPGQLPPQPSAGCPHGLGHSFGRHLRFSLLRFIPVFLQV